MEQLEIKRIIRKLKKKEISVFDIPKQYKNSSDIVNFERKSGLRITGKRGFDIISNSFFAEEMLLEKNNKGEEIDRDIVIESFDDFDSYYDFLNGDIYDNACYAFCPFDNMNISGKIDVNELMIKKSFVENTIDDYSFELSREEKEDYKKGKKAHKRFRQWIEKFNNCYTFNEFEKIVKNYYRSNFNDISFFLFQYIFADVMDKRRFFVIMEYVLSRDLSKIRELCLIYGFNNVERFFDYFFESRYKYESPQKRYKYKTKFKNYVSQLKNEEIKFYSKAFFDKHTHYYCEKIYGYTKDEKNPITTISKCFETFEEFVDYRKGDLTNCDLFNAFECNADFSKYIVDETTILPIHAYTEVSSLIKKGYCNGYFYVNRKWLDKNGRIIKKFYKSFDYFFDFVVFLKGDLSDSDLSFCDGLINLRQWSGIDFKNAKMKSNLCEKFGLQFEDYPIKKNIIRSFKNIEKNERETALILQDSRNLIVEEDEQDLTCSDLEMALNYQEVGYISDIHLMHKIQNAGCRSKEDVFSVVQKIVNMIAKDAKDLLLIGGDVASDFELFQLFVEMLDEALQKTTVIFVLGNHELWSFSGFTIDEIVLKYRNFLENYGMYLLHNDLLYYKECIGLNENFHLIKYDELSQISNEEISECLRNSRYVILGGLGFSGYNEEFNADNGIYRDIIGRKEEIKQTKEFEKLYDRLSCILTEKNTIIFTHMPKRDWCSRMGYEKKFVYVSGHTHKNLFHDDGEIRIYSDNQIGYHNDKLYLKTFLIENEYDYFFDYSDGIFEITSEQYRDFYLGKNISMSFQRETNVLYMLKKNGYYCFLHKSKGDSLTILNGGAMKKLDNQSVHYYYDNMEAMISIVKKPLDKFTGFQESIANIIKKLGGEGTIHGCIIDIDYYNHIYVNPNDFSFTGYWAFDIIKKIVYRSIPDLLEAQCPQIFQNYCKSLKGSKKNPLVPIQQKNITPLFEEYLDTDIYEASRHIKKMQRLNSNILSVWYENKLPKKRALSFKE